MDLAIVIPAYKIKFLRDSLLSLKNQTCQSFNVYIGDDCSPNDLKSIVDEFPDLNILYHRFKENLGGKDLVEQWKRCVALSKNEKWIWLFSDDDIADSNCVDKFYSIAKKSDVEVFRFNTATINSQGKVGSYSVKGPDYETCESMAYNLLLGNRGNSMPDHIFSRKVYEEKNGFVNTAFGQSADWATSILFSQEKGIQIIPDAILYWRRSGDNITSLASTNRDLTLIGYLQFVNWVSEHFQYLKNRESSISYEQMINALRANFLSVITFHYKGFSLRIFRATTMTMRGSLQLSWISCVVYVIRVYSRTGPLINFLVRCKHLLKSIVK